MRIECPACAATYEVPEDRLAPGRLVRCARCGSDWMPLPPEPIAEPVREPEPAEPEPEVPSPRLAPSPAVVPLPAPALERDEAPHLRLHLSALSIAWALSVIVLLAGIWGAYAGRDAIMHAWPPSVRAYAALGLTQSH
jgi:predicted Zn finger-like uncharacterized protein